VIFASPGGVGDPGVGTLPTSSAGLLTGVSRRPVRGRAGGALGAGGDRLAHPQPSGREPGGDRGSGASAGGGFAQGAGEAASGGGLGGDLPDGLGALGGDLDGGGGGRRGAGVDAEDAAPAAGEPRQGPGVVIGDLQELAPGGAQPLQRVAAGDSLDQGGLARVEDPGVARVSTRAAEPTSRGIEGAGPVLVKSSRAGGPARRG